MFSHMTYHNLRHNALMTGDSLFSEWLLREIEARGLTYSDVARQGKISHARVSQVLAGELPGKRFCLAIAKALQIPAETVFREAGLLPPVPEPDAALENALYLFRRLTVADQERILAMMRALVELSEAEEK